MRYLHRTKIKDIIEQYDYIIGWGTGPIMRMNYMPRYYKIDYFIDGTGKSVGNQYYGILVKNASILEELHGKKLVIIYTIYEAEILQHIKKIHDNKIDVIIYSLLDISLEDGYYIPEVNGKNGEDILLFSLINQLQLQTIKYIEIGVCHPVMRNNTFMLNELFSDTEGYRGCLVEANPICWDLIQDYRKNDCLVKAGVKAEQQLDELIFYAFPGLLGHSTFKKSIADELIKKGYKCCKYNVPVLTLDSIIEQYFDETPDVLAIDAEGVDYEVLCSWDSEKYSFKIVITEIMQDEEKLMENLMISKGYKIYSKTIENILWVKKDYPIFV